MAYRYAFTPAAAKDLMKLTAKNQRLLLAITTEHIPAILEDPYTAGEPKKGDLVHVHAFDLKFKNVAYRLIYQITGEVVSFIAVGTHDRAYASAKRR
jgi:mRNA-degrading endonuclease RelE of RelBE toxin-antitoxin system